MEPGGEERAGRPAPRNRLRYELVVFRVSADPKPDNSVRCIHSKRSIVEPNASGPEPADFLEMQRRMLWVCL